MALRTLGAWLALVAAAAGSPVCAQAERADPAAPPRFSQVAGALTVTERTPAVQAGQFPCGTRTCTQAFHALPTDRSGVTMNVVVLKDDAKAKAALLVIPGSRGSDGRVAIRGLLAPSRGNAMQYLYENAQLFLDAGVTLVGTGCPSDQTESLGQCADDYRKSPQYAQDFSKIIDLLKTHYGYEKFYLFGHSSGGISTRWLSVNLPDTFAGVIHSSIMNGRAGPLATSTIGFDMRRIQVPMLHIAHVDDQCPSTPYFLVTRYARDNLVTVKGGGTTGDVCAGAHHHSFEGRQRGVSRAIVRWITTGQVQALVDSDD